MCQIRGRCWCHDKEAGGLRGRKPREELEKEEEKERREQEKEEEEEREEGEREGAALTELGGVRGNGGGKTSAPKAMVLQKQGPHVPELTLACLSIFLSLVLSPSPALSPCLPDCLSVSPSVGLPPLFLTPSPSLA